MVRSLELTEIYDRYFRDVFVFLCGLTADEHTAEEIAQETFVKAVEAIDSFDGTKDIRAWLFVIARNSYYSYCRKNKREYPLPEEESGISDGVSFTDAVEDEEQAFLIHAFIHEMSEPYKEVFMLRAMGELPFRKIGEIFGKSDTWARVTFYRAKARILEYMEGENHE